MTSNKFSPIKVARHIFKLAFLIGTLVTILLAPAWAETAMVWSQYEEPDINVYYSPDGAQIVALSSQGTNVAPNLFKSPSSSWVTWIDKSNVKASQLKFAQVTNSGKILEIGTIPTTHPGIYGPAIAIDPSESRVWAVWAENNGRQEVLYASFRDLGKLSSGEWKTPLQITSDDDYSSNLPVFNVALLNQINISWMRISPKASETVSASYFISDWGPSTSTRKVDQSSAQATTVNYRNLRVKRMQGYDALIKRLNKGQSLSSDEQTWKDLVHNKDAISGAVHSGSGHSKRLVEAKE